MIGAKVIVEIHKRHLLQCPALTNSEDVRSIAWFHCHTTDCNSEWHKGLIARVEIEDIKKKYAVSPNFDIYFSGALVIKKVLPVHDGKLFICMVQKNLREIEMSTTILHIAKGDVYISVIQ